MAAGQAESGRYGDRGRIFNYSLPGREAGHASHTRIQVVCGCQDTLVGIELMHMIKKRQRVVEEGEEGLTAAEQFYALAA